MSIWGISFNMKVWCLNLGLVFKLGLVLPRVLAFIHIWSSVSGGWKGVFEPSVSDSQKG